MINQEVNGFIFPNSIIDELLSELSHSELKCYLVVLRKTKGWNKEEDYISVSQFMNVTGLSNRSVIDACESLVERGILDRKVGERNTNIYSIKTYKPTTSEKSSPVKNFPTTSEKSSPVTSEKSSHTKNTIKNNITNTPLNPPKGSDSVEIAFYEFWSAGLVKLNRQKAVKAFERAFKSWRSSHAGNIFEFTGMLVADIHKRLQLQQFGFDRMHPTTYLNGKRWEDDYQAQNQTRHSAAFNPFDKSGNWAKGRTITVKQAVLDENSF